MYQYDDSTVASALPTPAAQGAVGFFTDGNPGLGVPATILRSDFMNMLMMEILNVVQAGGLTPSKSTYNQLLTAINNLIGSSAGTAVTAISAGSGISVSRSGNTVTVTNTGSSGGGATITLTVPSFLSLDHSSITGSGEFTIGLSGQALPVSSGGTGATNAAAALLALGGVGAAQQVKQTGVTIGASTNLYNTLTFTAPGPGRILAIGIVNIASSSYNLYNTVSINGSNTNTDVISGSSVECSSVLVAAGSVNTIQQTVSSTTSPPPLPFSMQLLYVFIPATS